MANELEVLMRDHDFVLYKDGKPALTPMGKEIAHSNARLLRQAATQHLLMGTTPTSSLNLVSLLLDSDEAVLEMDAQAIPSDPLISKNESTAGGQHTLLFDYPELVHLVLQNSSSLHSAFNNFVARNSEETSLEEYIKNEFSTLSKAQKVVFNVLNTEFNCGIILHFLLCKHVLSASEYASGIIVSKLKSGDPNLQRLFQQKKMEGLKQVQLEITQTASLALDFLTLFKNKNKLSVIEEIISRGEDSNTEFKSTLRWDIRQSKKNPAIEHAALKTICAFLNSEGGDLLIGVRDDGSIEGFETDQFPNDDRFLLHLWTLIKTCMGQEVVEWVKTSIQQFGNKTVCRVNCKKGKKPTFLRQKSFDEAFYVRVGPSSSSLDISAAMEYIKQHFV